MKKIFIGIVAAITLISSAHATGAEFRVFNRSNEAVQRIYVSPPSETHYGDKDLLGDQAVHPGHDLLINPWLNKDSQFECVLDVIAIGANGRKWRKQIDVCKFPNSWSLYNAPTGLKKIQ
jgi:hypothetical protein